MKTSPPNESDEIKLRTLLRDALPSRDVPPRFVDSVWKSIERCEVPAEAGRSSGFWSDFLSMLVIHRRVALAMSVLLILASSAGGFLTAEDAAKSAIRNSYFTTVSPFLKTSRS